MWVVPGTPGIAPEYEQLDISEELTRGGLVVVASGMDKHRDQRAIHINNKYAALQVARLAADQTVEITSAPFVHLFVARGAVDLEGAGVLGTGDSARITASDGRRITARDDAAEVLIWEMHATLG